jgi:hypothetical protein
MDWLVWVILIVVVVVVLAARLKPQGVKGFPYKKNPVLFSPAERSFLGVLEQAVGDKHRVFGKLRVADVVSVKSMSDRRAWQRAFNKISESAIASSAASDSSPAAQLREAVC